MDGIPTLVFVDGMTGNLITRDGRDIIVSDPNGDKFPWSPPSFSEVIVNCKFISRDKKKTAWRQLKGKIVGIFFSVPWVYKLNIIMAPILVDAYIYFSRSIVRSRRSPLS